MRVGSFRRELNRKGQKISKFKTRNHTHYLIVIREFYYRAGDRFWKEAVKNGISPEGFSINDSIYNLIPLEELLVFEKSSSTFYKLKNPEKVRRLKGTDHRKGVKLHVLPLSGFKTARIVDLDNVLSSPVDLSRTDLTTRQVKLGGVKA